MNYFWEFAAATFVTVQLIKFAWGAFAQRFNVPEFDAVGELMACLAMSTLLTVRWDGTSGDVALATSIAFFAITVWSTLQFKRVQILSSLYGGRGR